MSQENNKTLILVPQAEQDFKAILRFTQEKWGIQQALNYRAFLEKELMALCLAPQWGISVAAISEGMSRWIAGKHKIFYQEFATEVRVYRILHQSRQVTYDVFL
jgi:plasmid stabilization system protein ParE